MNILREVGSYAGLAAFVGLAIMALLYIAQARDVRRLREWAGSAPERDAGLVEATSEVAAGRAEELKRLEAERERKEKLRQAELRVADLRETRRQRREAGLPEQTMGERLRERVGGDPARERSGWLRYALALLFVLGVAALAVFVVIPHFSGSNEGGGGGRAKQASPLNPGRVEVAVLNGTATPGLANRFSDTIGTKGFQIGAVTNSSSSFTESVVMFKPGFKPEAKAVARDLKIEKVKPMSAEISAAAQTANVAAVIGENDVNGPTG